MAGNSATLAAVNTAFRARTGFPTGGVASFNGTGAQTAFSIPHGQAGAPNHYWAIPISEAAHAKRTVTVTSTNIVITYATAPASGTGNLKFRWGSSRLL
jgi:hypothetical protein